MEEFNGEESIWRNSAFMAKKLGFRGKTYDFYTTMDKCLYQAKRDMNPEMKDYNDGSWSNRVSAPTKTQIRLWLIENFDIHISSKSNKSGYRFDGENENTNFEFNLLTVLTNLLS
jgi:hypothetical protein